MKLSSELTKTALTAWLDREESDLDELLGNSCLITGDERSPTSAFLLPLVHELLARTIEHVDRSTDSPAAPQIEVILGNALARYPAARHVYVSWGGDEVKIGNDAGSSSEGAGFHQIVLTIVACHIAAATVNALLNYPFSKATTPIRLRPAEMLGSDPTWATDVMNVGELVLAGAGAVGNGFLTGLACFSVEGQLHIVDPKSTQATNLPRCLWLKEGDVGLSKAEALAMRAQDSVPRLKLRPWQGTISAHRRDVLPGARIARLVVGVDSRRARRRLQAELPREVFDASTTGISEVVLHFNDCREPLACMACIYKEDIGERQHEEHVAKSLGVPQDLVRGEFVTPEAAERIVRKYPTYSSEALVGRAFDSLFRELCATGSLVTEADRQVLAPLPFVSVLVGCWLALETVRRISGQRTARDFNYWRLSPWHSPNSVLRQVRTRDPGCELCAEPAVRRAMSTLWGSSA